MKSRVQKIEIQNFKAFRQFSLNLEGRHLLLYGANGSGKSSLYWALYTFLQSAAKTEGSISKYFTTGAPENLLNIHEQKDSSPRPGEIALSLKGEESATVTTFRINEYIHASTDSDKGTCNETLIRRANLASDFITYRFFFGFSHFRNSQDFDLWPLFEKEILPFCVSTGGHSPLVEWKKIELGIPNPHRLKGASGRNAFDRFEQSTQVFADILLEIVDSISNEAQRFYDQHFADTDPAAIELKLKVTQNAQCQGNSSNTFKFKKPVIGFGIRVGGDEIKRPQSFLNEAKLTQLALSVRFAASMVNLHESDLKLLVLDDLLVSLDLDNRMKVVEILLGSDFENYQKIILTHDRGFFEEFKRMIGTNHSDWCFRSLQGNPKDGITDKLEKTPIQKAQDYINGHDLEAAAVQLRKAAEDTLANFTAMKTGQKVVPGEFASLAKRIREAKNLVEKNLPQKFYVSYRKAMSNVPESHRSHLLSLSDIEINAFSQQEQGIIRDKRKKLQSFLNQDHWKCFVAMEKLDELSQNLQRSLNPAAHWNNLPLYQGEVDRALQLVDSLQASLLNTES